MGSSRMQLAVAQMKRYQAASIPSFHLVLQELTERYIHNSPTQVGITEVDPFNRRFVCSEQTGLENNVLRELE